MPGQDHGPGGSAGARMGYARELDAVRFDEEVVLKLRNDEAIVLGCLLSRELWGRGSERLAGLIEHPAESHALHALLQELVPTLYRSGSAQGADEDGAPAPL
jgi:hypothetical protein